MPLTISQWRTAMLKDTLPGLASFLCEYADPHRHYGRTAPDSPLRYVELEVGLAEPKRAVPTYEQILKVQSRAENDSYLLPLDETPIRLARGEGVYVHLRTLSSNLISTSVFRFPNTHLQNVSWAIGDNVDVPSLFKETAISVSFCVSRLNPVI
jgi:hypothetical protein